MKDDAPTTGVKSALPEGREAGSSSDEANAPSRTPPPAKDHSDVESVGGQWNTMSRKRMLLAFSALSVCLFVSFIDQTSVSTAVPAIAGDLDTGTATSWIGTSFLIASTAF
ncbi:efflux pump antibiotic resistance [Colletotrichum kahawae]|uniref:Efflux pump antibiotic resistance n=1 Tax=Colletotrichum kahawae TaxID=34407 RepID=A0AAD9YPT3_COLKA|nr:efflux pump antibiotic resistance [Colletotrichum kahawae]